MALGIGSIAFVGFNADGPDNLAFVVLETIPAGTVITFTDNEWNGTSFNTGEATWSWTATGEIAAGSVVTMDGLAAGQTATSNLGTIAFSDQTQRDIDVQNETVYAYTGAPGAPAFLSAISSDNFGTANGALTNTGLVQGQTALSLTSLDADADIAVYGGVRGAASFPALLPLINNPANWVSQDGNGDQYNDGIRPDVPFVTAPFAGDPNFQTIVFAGGTATLSQAEGNNGQTVIVFTVERLGGTTGAVQFSGTIGGTTNGADFGGTKPLTFSGTIADGATTATVTINVSGDTLLEADETVVLTLTGAQNAGASAVLGVNVVKTAIVTNDDPYVVVDGQVFVGGLTVPAGKALTVEDGGTVQGDVLLLNPGVLPSVTNSGTISGATGILVGNNRALDFTGGITIVNKAGGLIEGTARAIRATADFHGSTFKLINEGTIKSASDETVRLDDAVNAVYVIENRAGGLILGGNPQNDVMRLGSNTQVINAGTIQNALDVPGAGRGGDGVDFKAGTGSSLHNLAGGRIEASRHAVTGERGLTVVNDKGGLLAGRNGSAVNIDNDATVANTVYVKNYGTMLGKSAHYEDSDGDAVDVDGLAVIENWGEISGLGHNGYHDGEPNVSEAIAMGGGTITNYKGGMLYGYGRAIQIDNSGNAGAFAATTIVNSGTIKGDGNLPTDVLPEDLAPFVERIKGGEAINIVGTHADTLTNNETGKIVGGVKMGGGDDVLVNAGNMTATGGSAIDMGDGNDTVTLKKNAQVSGDILLGAGNDTLTAVDGNRDIEGGAGDDVVTTGKGEDFVLGGTGNDTLDGGTGNDMLDGGADNDFLFGGDGHDDIYGGQGNDALVGGEGDDTLKGDEGRDLLLGGARNDELDGGDGDDVLIGGSGNDVMTGGEGSDIFVFGSSFNRDNITDFNAAEDRIIVLTDAQIATLTGDLSNLDAVLASFDAITSGLGAGATFKNVGGGVEINSSVFGKVLLEDLSIAELRTEGHMVGNQPVGDWYI
ncbi:hypothetical protein IZ6_03550 [Terrihabitans soli]|uniref:Calcium-binding protein n=1 Tax=Terrihabitans soli TaxID=708113 RepID=A0A6S6QRV7_9HYPH|nr:hypothetical protein [Terrihabitans soli]BCJ89620.1 hypothetical protein IZ6_03550 [Terrihabitans soli]